MRIAVTVAVIICYPLTVGLGVEAFLPVGNIDYERCYSTYPAEPTYKMGEASESAEAREQANEAYDQQKRCIDDQKENLKPESTRNFVVISLLGVLAILSGMVYVSIVSEPVRQGLVLGGVVSVIYANMRFGDAHVDMRWKFVSALVTLVAVIIVSRRWFGSVKK